MALGRPRLRLRIPQHRTRLVEILLLVVTFTIGFATTFWLPLRLGYLILFGLVAAWAWTALSGRGLVVRLRRGQERVQAGQTIVEMLEIENRLRLPKFWLEVSEESTRPAHAGRWVVSLAGRSRRSWRWETVCTRRGVYTLGPVTVRSGDPFDFFHSERTFGDRRQVVVYPRPLDLPLYGVPPANLPGEGRFRRRTYYVTPNASGIREYEPGDSVKRIHWPSTLRTGRMQVKTFELDPASHHWVVLDLHRATHAGEGDDSTIEVGVTAAASVARQFLAQSRSVGLMMFGQRFEVIEPDRGSGQLTRILEALAVAAPSGDIPLSELLYRQARSWGRHTTLVVVTAATDRHWVDALRSLTRRGVRVAVIFLDRASFDPAAGDPAAVAAIADAVAAVEAELLASDLQTSRVRRGDALPAVLRAPQGGGGGAPAGVRPAGGMRAAGGMMRDALEVGE